MPDLTILLDGDPIKIRNRITTRKKISKYEGIEFQEKIRELYLNLSKKFPERIIVYKILDENEMELFQKVKEMLKVRGI